MHLVLHLVGTIFFNNEFDSSNGPLSKYFAFSLVICKQSFERVGSNEKIITNGIGSVTGNNFGYRDIGIRTPFFPKVHCGVYSITAGTMEGAIKRCWQKAARDWITV